MVRFTISSCVIIILTLSVVQAGVIVESKYSTNMASMFGFEFKTTAYIEGDRLRNDVEMDGGSMGMMGGDMSGMMGESSILRADKGVMWKLFDDSTYEETDLETLKAMLTEDTVNEKYQIFETGEDSVSGEDWEKAEDKIRRTIEGSDSVYNINGYECRKYIINTVVHDDEDPDMKLGIFATLYVTDDIPGQDVYTNYQKNIAGEYGLDFGAQNFGGDESMGRLLGTYMQFYDSLVQNDEVIMKNIIEMKMSVPDSLNEVSAAELLGEDSGSEDAAMMMQMIKMMQSMAKEIPEDGMLTIMSMTGEITGIKEAAIEESRFEVPEGYEKR